MNSKWMNRGSLVQQTALDDRGFRFGWRVMTTMLALEAKIIDFDWHMERLAAHAEQAGLSQGFRADVIRFELESLLQSSKRAACRVYLTANSGGIKDAITSTERWIHVEELPQLATPATGLKLQPHVEAGWSRGGKVKTGFYTHALPILPRAQAQGFDDILWCNSDHELAETTTANIFLIGRDGDLVEIATPPETSGVLPGITKRRLIQLLTASKIPVTERVIYKEEIPRFDEAFVTSSLAGPIPVASIGGHKLQTVRPTAVFSHIHRLWNTWLSTQI